MELLVDIGNSRFKWAVLDRWGLREPGQATHGGRAAVPRDAAGHWQALPPPERVLGCAVARAGLVDAFASWCRAHWHLEPHWLHSQAVAYGVVNGYPNPAQLGADRWAALIAVRARGASTACVVDCGTAITIDLLTPGGHHAGGVIAPGLSMMRSALARGTGGVGEATDPGASPSLLADNTRDAVLAGTFHAVTGLINGVVARIEAERGPAVECVITGGDTARLLPHLIARYRHEPLLVLHGLAVVAGGPL